MFSGLDAIDLRHGRRWTALASFVLQGILVSAALVLPLLHPASLPEALLRHPLFTPIAFRESTIRVTQQAPHNGAVQTPAIVVQRPFTYQRGTGHATADPTTESPSAPPAIGPDVGPSVGDRFAIILPAGPVQPILRPAPKPKPPISVVMESNLIHRVDPQYPAIAREIHLQGVVVLQAIVSAEGTTENIQVVSGPAILALAARDAVKQWRYRPFSLNGKPVPVETQITVKFVMNQ